MDDTELLNITSQKAIEHLRPGCYFYEFPLKVQQSKVFSTSTSGGFSMAFLWILDHPGADELPEVPRRSPAPSSIYGKIYVGVPPQVQDLQRRFFIENF